MGSDVSGHHRAPLQYNKPPPPSFPSVFMRAAFNVEPGTVLANLVTNLLPIPTRCSFAKLPEEQLLLQIYALLPMEDKVNFAFTCKPFLPLLLHGRVDVALAQKGGDQHKLLSLTANASYLRDARNLSNVTELRIFSHARPSQRPDANCWPKLTFILDHMHTLRLHRVRVELWALEVTGLAERLQVLDLTESTLEAKTHRHRDGEWAFLRSGSTNLRQLILRDARITVNYYNPTAAFEDINLPQLWDVDIIGLERSLPTNYPIPGAVRPVSPHVFCGCPSLVTVAYSQDASLAEESPLAGIPALRAADVRLAGLPTGPLKLPPQVTSLTLRGVEGNYRDVSDALREAAACIGRGMHLQHLGCALFRVAADLEVTLPGVKSVQLEPVDTNNRQARISDTRLQSLIGSVLRCTPDVERLELGAYPSRLTVPETCARLGCLSIRWCPLGLKEIQCAGLKRLSLSHAFKRCAVGSSREADAQEVDLAGCMMNSLQSFTLSVSSFCVGDTCKICVHAVPGRRLCRVLAYQGDAVGEWVLSVSLQGQEIDAAQVPQPIDIIFSCVDVHGRAGWEVQHAIAPQ